MAYGGAWKQMVTQGGQTNLALREKGGMGDKLRTALAGVTKAKLGLAKEGRGQADKLEQVRTAAQYKEYPETITGGEPKDDPMSQRKIDADGTRGTAAQREATRLGGQGDYDIDLSEIEIPTTKKHFWSKQEYRNVSVPVKEYADSIKTFKDVKVFLNNYNSYEQQLGEDDITALFDYVDINILDNLTIEQKRHLTKLGYDDFLDELREE